MGLVPAEMSASVEKYGISYLRPHHREIARRLVLGQNSATISRALHMSQSRLSIIINSPLFKRELKRLEEQRDNGVADIAQTLQELSPVALEAVERTMYNARSERLRFDAASTILDRAGYSSINKTKIDLTTASTTPYSSMLEDELRQMLLNRVERIKSMNAEREKEKEESEAMQLEFEVVDEECSDFEQSSDGHKPINVMSD